MDDKNEKIRIVKILNLPIENKQTKGLNQFCKKITEHRNKFSHVKAKGDYLKDEDNEKYARILYTTIRVLIYKYLRGEFA